MDRHEMIGPAGDIDGALFDEGLGLIGRCGLRLFYRNESESAPVRRNPKIGALLPHLDLPPLAILSEVADDAIRERWAYSRSPALKPREKRARKNR
jgi:hypothetical protein